MALTSFSTRRVEIPHEPGQFLTLRQLPWPILDAAKEAKFRKQVELQRVAGIELIEALTKDSESAPALPAEAKPINFDATYDRGIILRAGLVDWSYEQPFSPDLVDELDEETAVFAFEELLKPAHRSEEERLLRFKSASQGA